MNIRLFNCSVCFAIMLSFVFLPVSAQQKRTPAIKETEQEQLLKKIGKLEKEILTLRKKSEFLKKHDAELKSYAEEIILKAGDPHTSANDRRLAAKMIPKLEYIVGKLDAKFDKAGFLIDSNQVAIRYLNKLKACRITLLDREEELLIQQNELLKQLQKLSKK